MSKNESLQKMMMHFHFQIGFVWGFVSLAAFLFSPFFGKYGSKIGPKLVAIAGGFTQVLKRLSMFTQLFMLMLAEQAIKAVPTHCMYPVFLACFMPFTQPRMSLYSHLNLMIKQKRVSFCVHKSYCKFSLIFQ